VTNVQLKDRKQLFAGNENLTVVYLLYYWHQISVATPQLELTALFYLHHGYHPSSMLSLSETAALSAWLSVHLL
jgi:hypothetical protein